MASDVDRLVQSPGPVAKYTEPAAMNVNHSDDYANSADVTDDLMASSGDDTALLPAGGADRVRCTRLYLLTLSSALGGFLFGYDTGVVSGAMVLVRRHFALSDEWHEGIVSAPLLTAWMFSLVAGAAADRVGRRPLIQASSLLFAVGSLLMGLASSRELLLVGRLVIGVGIGLSSMTVPVYISECAPVQLRGQLVTINCLMITGGQLVAGLLCGALASATDGWRWMLGAAAVPAGLQLMALWSLPESPRQLVATGQLRAAAEALLQLRPDGYPYDRELQLMRREVRQAAAGLDSRPLRRLLDERPARRALMVGCALQIIQQLAGINTVMYYSASLIRAAGVRRDADAIWLSAATAGFNVAGTLAGLVLVERLGRRPLLLWSLAGSAVSLLLLAAGLYTADQYTYPVTEAVGALATCRDCISTGRHGFCFHTPPLNSSCLPVAGHVLQCPAAEFTWTADWCPSSLAWLSVAGLCLYLSCFSPGMGPMPWTINAELYPLWARATANGAATSFNWLTNLMVSLSFLSLCSALTRPGVFVLYACLAAVGWLFLYVTLPETKGVPLEQVANLFSQSGRQQPLEQQCRGSGDKSGSQTPSTSSPS